MPRAAAWNLLCHFATEAVVITRLVRDCAPAPRPEFTFGVL
jgi:hypothetical protein